MDDRNVAVWWAIAATSSLWALLALGAGDGAVLPGILGAVALVCATNAAIRDRWTGKALRTFSGSGLRTAIILVGAMMLWQFVGLELALLVAGDVLAYAEVLAAVSLIAANTRLKPLKALVVRRLDWWRKRGAARFARASRAIRTIRPPRIGSPPADDEGGARGFAFA